MIEESSEFFDFEEVEDQEEFIEIDNSYDISDEIEIIDDDPVFVDTEQDIYISESGSGSHEDEFLVKNSENAQNEEVILSDPETTTDSEDLQKIYEELVTLNGNIEQLTSEVQEIKADQIIMGNNDITFFHFGIGILASILGGIVASSFLRNVG